MNQNIIKLFFCLLISFNQLEAQINSDEASTFVKYPNHSCYAELLGNGLIFSLNYERKIIQVSNTKVMARAGISPGLNYTLYPSMPFEINSFMGRKRHNGEVGLGYLLPIGISLMEGYRHTSYFSLRSGYRYQSAKGFLVRAGLLLFIPEYDLFKVSYYWRTFYTFYLFPGLSLGYSFKKFR